MSHLKFKRIEHWFTLSR